MDELDILKASNVYFRLGILQMHAKMSDQDPETIAKLPALKMNRMMPESEFSWSYGMTETTVCGIKTIIHWNDEK